MKTISTIQWYNENENRSYPMAEYATHKDNLGRELPPDIIVDLSVMTPPEHAQVYFSSIRVTSALVSVALRSPTSGMLIGTFARSQLRPHTAYPLTPVIDDVSGWIVFGTHRAVVTEDYRFTVLAQSAVETKAVHVIEHLPVRSFRRLGGSTVAYADHIVSLVPGNGVVIEKADLPPRIIIRLSTDMQNQFTNQCQRGVSTDVCKTTPIRKISGVCPDVNGMITLRFE
jgi:hypothetical protein